MWFKGFHISIASYSIIPRLAQDDVTWFTKFTMKACWSLVPHATTLTTMNGAILVQVSQKNIRIWIPCSLFCHLSYGWRQVCQVYACQMAQPHQADCILSLQCFLLPLNLGRRQLLIKAYKISVPATEGHLPLPWNYMNVQEPGALPDSLPWSRRIQIHQRAFLDDKSHFVLFPQEGQLKTQTHFHHIVHCISHCWFWDLPVVFSSVTAVMDKLNQ